MRYYLSLFALLIAASFSTASADLIGKWTFDGTDPLADSSGKDNNLTVHTGSAAVADGAFNVAGNNRLYVDLGDQAQLNAFTVSVWAKNTAWGWQDAWEVKGTATDSQVGLRLEANDVANDGSYTFYTTALTSFNSMAVKKLAAPPDGWHHIVYTINTDGTASAFLDGVKTNNNSGNTASGKIGKFTIGGCYSQRGPLVGQMDNVQVYNRALQLAEVVALYDNANRATGDLSDVYSRSFLTGSHNWSDSAWALNGSGFTNAWVDGSLAAITLESGATLNVDQAVSADKLLIAFKKDDSTDAPSATFNVADTGALTVNSLVFDDSGSKEAIVHKTGAGTMSLSDPSNSWTSLIVEEGTVLVAAPSGVKTSPVVVKPGASFGLLASNTEAYPELSVTLEEGSDLDVLINSTSEYSRFTLPAKPSFDGFLEILVADSANLPSSASFKLSNAYPGGSLEDLDLESWLAPDTRYEWNLSWSAADSALTLSHDSAAAVPEPATWALLILGVLLIPAIRNKRRAA